MTPVVTVLMAVHDPPLAMLDQAVRSIRRQTLSDFEFLIIDDGSQDPAAAGYLAGCPRRDPRIRIVRQPHAGLTAALNRGLDLARGGLVARQDADDWSEPERLERQLEYFRAHPETTALGTIAWTHQQDGRLLWRLRLPTSPADILKHLPRGNPFVHGTVMFPRWAAAAIGGYREQFRCAQDYDFLWRLAETGPAANLAEPLYHYRYTTGSVSAARTVEQARTRWAIQRLAEARRRGEPENPARALAEARNFVPADAALKQADHLMLAGNYGEAFKVLRSHGRSLRAWAKLARLGLFRAIPVMREACFR